MSQLGQDVHIQTFDSWLGATLQVSSPYKEDNSKDLLDAETRFLKKNTQQQKETKGQADFMDTKNPNELKQMFHDVLPSKGIQRKWKTSNDMGRLKLEKPSNSKSPINFNEELTLQTSQLKSVPTWDSTSMNQTVDFKKKSRRLLTTTGMKNMAKKIFFRPPMLNPKVKCGSFPHSPELIKSLREKAVSVDTVCIQSPSNSLERSSEPPLNIAQHIAHLDLRSKGDRLFAEPKILLDRFMSDNAGNKLPPSLIEAVHLYKESQLNYHDLKNVILGELRYQSDNASFQAHSVYRAGIITESEYLQFMVDMYQRMSNKERRWSQMKPDELQEELKDLVRQLASAKGSKDVMGLKVEECMEELNQVKEELERLRLEHSELQRAFQKEKEKNVDMEYKVKLMRSELQATSQSECRKSKMSSVCA